MHTERFYKWLRVMIGIAIIACLIGHMVVAICVARHIGSVTYVGSMRWTKAHGPRVDFPDDCHNIGQEHRPTHGRFQNCSKCNSSYIPGTSTAQKWGSVWIVVSALILISGISGSCCIIKGSGHNAKNDVKQRNAEYIRRLKNDMDYSQYPNLNTLCKELRNLLNKYQSLQKKEKVVLKAGKSRFSIYVLESRQWGVFSKKECLVMIQGNSVYYANDDLLFQLPIVLDYLKGEVERLEEARADTREFAEMQKEANEQTARDNMRVRKENLTAIDSLL